MQDRTAASFDARMLAVGDAVVHDSWGFGRVETRTESHDEITLTIAIDAGRLTIVIVPGTVPPLRRPIDAAAARALLDVIRDAPPDPRPRGERSLDVHQALLEGTLEQRADRLGRLYATAATRGERRQLAIYRVERAVLGEIAAVLERSADELADELWAYVQTRAPLPAQVPDPIRTLVAVDATVPWPSQDPGGEPVSRDEYDEERHVGAFTVTSGALHIADTARLGALLPGRQGPRADWSTASVPAQNGRWHVYSSAHRVRLVRDGAPAGDPTRSCGVVGVESGSIGVVDDHVKELPEVRDAMLYRMDGSAFPWGWAGGTGGDGDREVLADTCELASRVTIVF